jgi:phosphoserine phosphatase RsbU/P
VFDLAARTVTCASAGHHAAMWVLPGQPPRPVFISSGRVLGLMPAATFANETIALEADETLVLFTDGVSEAFDANQELFGEERLIAQLQAPPDRTAGETTLGVLEAVRRHATGAKQSDDITVLSVRYRGQM